MHDMTAPILDGAVGFTIHCNYNPVPSAPYRPSC